MMPDQARSVPQMHDGYLQSVKEKYESKGEDYSDLFDTILLIAAEASMDIALECLQRCVTEKRTLWLEANLAGLQLTGNAVEDAHRAFYGGYLGISPPRDGEIVERTPFRLVTRWWNPCPVLDVCQKFGLDTREVCKKAYHHPVQVFLSRIEPRLRFDRNYDALRPHTTYCEEMITLVD